MNSIRKLSAFEVCPIRCDVYVQLAMKFATRQETKEAAEILLEKAMGTRCASDGKHVYKVNEKLSIMEIPNFENIHDAAVFATTKTTPKQSVALANVCMNDNTVVLNSNHICSDGGYLMELNKLILGKSKMSDNHMPYPISPEKSFADEIISTWGVPNNNSTEFNFDKNKFRAPKKGELASHYRFIAPYKTLVGFDPRKNKVDDITNRLWSSVVMTASAFNGKIDKFGTFTCVNLRPYLKNPSFDHTDTFSKIAQTVPMTDWNEPISSVCKRFRKQFEAHREDLYRNLKTFSIDDPPYENVGCELSNVGTFYAKGPIKDVYAGLSMKTDSCLGEICLLTYTIEREKEKECVGQVRYPSSRVSHKDGAMISESMKYFLQNIPLTATVKQAVDELREFQRKYKSSQ